MAGQGPKTDRFHRLFYMLRYHRLRQLTHRSWKIVRHNFNRGNARLATPPFGLTAANEIPFRPILESQLIARGESSSQLDSGRLTLLNQTLSFESSIPWQLPPGFDALWGFNLHYHEFLLDLVKEDLTDLDCLKTAWHVVVDWIDSYPISTPGATSLGWHPFCISRRIPIWILLGSVGRPTHRWEDVLQSVFQQVSYLNENLELDLEGNHLLENLRALTFAGAWLQKCSQSTDWIQTVRRVLARQLDEQILAHGEHFERSTMYHVAMLEVILDIADLTEHMAPDIHSLCVPAIGKMVEFMDVVVCPDGTLPMFGDAAIVSNKVIVDLQDRAKRYGQRTGGEKATQIQTAGGYWAFRTTSDWLVFDAADAGADSLPGHAHADLLNLELWLDGIPILVDSGVYDYGDTEMRKYCRGSTAHNVLLVDGLSQFDQWSRFRMGYRGHAGELVTGIDQDASWAEATHDAYRRVGIPTTGRRIGMIQPDSWVCVDWVCGSDQHTLVSQLQLHPAVRCVLADSKTALLYAAGREYLVRSLGGGHLTVRPGWHCAQFGDRTERAILATTIRDSALPKAVGWLIQRPHRPVHADLITEGGQWCLNFKSAGDTTRWTRKFASG